MKSFNEREKGFTFLELLIVVSILGILAAVSLPQFLSLRTAGNVAAANAEHATVQSAADAYYAQHDGAIPSLDATDMDAYIRGGWAAIKGEYGYDPLAPGRVIAIGAGTWVDVAVDPATNRFIRP